MATRPIAVAEEIVGRCWELAACTEEPGRITRTFLSPPMRRVHELVGGWMREAGLAVSIDSAGNIRGVRGPVQDSLMIGSHLDTVPNAGAYDGILGVVMGIALARECPGAALAVVGFSEEEGVRFGVPFIGSRAVVGNPIVDTRIDEAVRAYGLEHGADASLLAAGYFEIHIEQGPVLEHRGLPVGVVDAIAGQSRFAVTFTGRANHAGTTPMALRRDALVSAAEFILKVDAKARSVEGLVATVGRCEVEPGAGNVIPGRVRASLDVRHKDDAVRRAAVAELLEGVSAELLMEVPATAMRYEGLAAAVAECGHEPFILTSGAGHDAMVMVGAMPAAMLFVRSPGGVSHHPDESVLVPDVAVAFACAKRYVEAWHG